jgi:hypothetical protein
MLNNAPLVRHTPPAGSFRLFCFRIAESSKFEIFIMACIILNAIALGLKWYGQDHETVLALDIVNLCFTAIFILEAVIKILAYKKVYFRDSWNRFDFFIVVVSVIEIILTFFISIQALVIVTLFRIFRVGRVLRLIKTAKGLRVIFSTFILTMP